jgi:hypothetical protein
VSTEPRAPAPPRYGRYVLVVALAIVALITINTIRTKPVGGKGIAPGHQLPPFAVPLLLGGLNGDADIATHAGEGARGKVPACQERGPQILNVCQRYERGPLVLALFLDAGSGPAIMGDLQSLASAFPGVQLAAVAIKGNRVKLRRLIRAQGVRVPVGYDRDGSLLVLYKVAPCPCAQVTFAYPGGVVQSPALVRRAAIATLRARIAELVAASKARGWRGGQR